MTTAAERLAAPAPGLELRGQRRLARLWPFTPAALVLGLLFLAPLAIALAASFWQTDRNLQLVADWTTKNYTYVLSQGPYLGVFAKTLVVAVIVTALGVATALPFAYFLVRYLTARWQRILLLAVVVPFWTSYLVRVYAWQSILGESGLLNQFLMAIGAVTEPLDVFLYNDVGVVIVLWYLYFPFAVLAIYTALERFDFTQLTAAQDLGASPAKAFRRILLPQVRPGLITACIFVFIPILGEYLTPTLVGGTKGILIGYDIVTFYQGGSYPLMAATAFLVAAVVVVLLVVLRRYLQVEDLVRAAG
jgi:spermidine/putrescine transport system permease protein